MRKKKTAHETVAEVIAKVNEELSKEVVPNLEPNKNHYYLCNVTLDNAKPCNCNAFI
jgi:hypothetical protein